MFLVKNHVANFIFKKKKKKKMDLKDVKNKSSDHAVFNENVWLYLEKKP